VEVAPAAGGDGGHSGGDARSRADRKRSRRMGASDILDGKQI
jgi:hypothetical protein